MTAPIPEPTPAAAARIAAIGYATLFALAIFANFFVRVRLVDTDDAAATFRNLVDSEVLVRVAVVAFIAVFLIDVVVAWALYHVFRPVGAAASSLAAWFRIVYTVFLGVATLFLFVALKLTDGAPHLEAYDQSQLDSQVMLALDAFDATWMIGLAAFGVHLVVIGALAWRTSVAPRPLAIVLGVAGLAYVWDTLAFSLLSSYRDHASVFTAIVAVPSVVAELWFTVWLFRRSRRTELDGSTLGGDELRSPELVTA